jgi:hypothetical protein
MKRCNNIEIILFPKKLSTDRNQKALMKWMATILRSAIEKQQGGIKKSFLKILEDTPAIYLS